MVYIEPGFYLFSALLLLVLPASWLMAAVFAAIFHELCHLVMIWLLGGAITGFSLGIGGARMDVRMRGMGSELIAALAGPSGSFLLLLFCRFQPQIAVCGCIQGIYNLLPVYPLDGGRALLCLLKMICPSRAEQIRSLIAWSCVILLMMLGFYTFSFGIWPFAASLFLMFGRIKRKTPCKQGRIGVQ